MTPDMLQFRKASLADIDTIAAIYDRIHTQEESGTVSIGWMRSIYPTEATARAALAAGDLYVALLSGAIAASARINQEQVPVYANARWTYPEAPASQVMVLHTLTVDPNLSGQGIGKAFVAFYEALAKASGCPYLRMDTNAKNKNARRLYRSLGYREADILPCQFNGIPGVSLVCLEKTLYRD